MKKSFLMLAMSFVFGTAAQAQTQNWEWTLKPQFDMEYIGMQASWTTHQRGELIAIYKNIDTIINRQPTWYSQISLVNKIGKLISSTPFEYLGYEVSEGLIGAQKNGKAGFIDNTGKWVIQPQFEQVEDFHDGLAGIYQNERYGFIDKTGKLVIQPQFERVGEFAKGLATAFQNDKWGVIDKTGKWVIQPQFSNISYSKWGLYKVQQNGKWGFIDKTGKWIIQPMFDDVKTLYIYVDDKIVVKDMAEAEIGGKRGLIDKLGKWIIEPKIGYSDFRYLDNDLIQVTKAGEYPTGETWENYGLVTLTGKTILPARYQSVESVSSDLIKYCDKSGCGLIDNNGQDVAQQKFQSIYSFSEGLAAAKQGNKWGFIDKAGQWVVQPQFEELNSFTEGLAAAQQGNKWGFIDKTGQWVIQPQFWNSKTEERTVLKFSKGFAIVSGKSGVGVIDKTGKWIVQPQFYDMQDFGNGVFGAVQGSDYKNLKLGFIRLKTSK